MRKLAARVRPQSTEATKKNVKDGVSLLISAAEPHVVNINAVIHVIVLSFRYLSTINLS